MQAAGSEAVGGCVEEIGDFGCVRGKRRLGKEVVEESSVIATARFEEELFRGCAVVGHCCCLEVKVWLVPGGIVRYVDKGLERERRFRRWCRSGGFKRSKDKALFEEGPGTAGLLEDVESQDCGCGTGMTDLKMKPTAGTRLGSGSGALGRQRSASPKLREALSFRFHMQI